MITGLESRGTAKETYKPHDFIGRNMQLLRHIHGMSQDAAADRFNISRTSYRYMEAGKRVPTLEFACAVSDYYGISLDLFISFDISKYILTMLQISSDSSGSFRFMEKYLRLSHGAKQQIQDRLYELHVLEFAFNSSPNKSDR